MFILLLSDGNKKESFPLRISSAKDFLHLLKKSSMENFSFLLSDGNKSSRYDSEMQIVANSLTVL